MELSKEKSKKTNKYLIKLKKIFKQLIYFLYPVFFGLLPAIAQYLNYKVSIIFVYQTWLVLLVFLGSIYFIILLITKNQLRTAIISSIIFLIYFYFMLFLRQTASLLYNLGLIQNGQDFSDSKIFPLILFLVWILLWIIAARYILRSDLLVNSFNAFFMVVSLLLMTFSIIEIVNKYHENTIIKNSNENYLVNGLDIDTINLPSSGNETNNEYPDIYYLIFDGFGSEEILTEYYDTNIHEFLLRLEDLGFFIPDSSRSNYSQTILSIPSSLNLSYIDDQSGSMENSSDWQPLARLIRNNFLNTYLREVGYEIVTFSSGFWPTEAFESDVKYEPVINFNDYQEMLILNTPIPLFYPNILYDVHRNRIQYSLDKLANIEPTEKPKFVFAHIFAPHPPFVFDQYGNSISPERGFGIFDAEGFIANGGTKSEYVDNYSQQLNFLLQEILFIVEEIINKSDTTPVIIIQGDHGPGSMVNQMSIEDTNLNERLSIMNAYYLPENYTSAIYEEITPVNSFRVILNSLFSADIPLLDDKSYFSTWYRPYKLIDVTDEIY